MNKIIKVYIVILCCILTVKSMVLSSSFVICDFDSRSNIEMLHTQKIAHAHNEDTDFDNHDEQLGSSCNNLTGEDQYSECIPCSDRHIYHEINLSQKRPSTKIDFSFYYRSVKKNDLIPSIINNNIIDNTDIRQLAYQPTITVLRI